MSRPAEQSEETEAPDEEAELIRCCICSTHLGYETAESGPWPGDYAWDILNDQKHPLCDRCSSLDPSDW